jgi:hypothetical protein
MQPHDPGISRLEGMMKRGFIISPGRLALANTFRIAAWAT